MFCFAASIPIATTSPPLLAKPIRPRPPPLRRHATRRAAHMTHTPTHELSTTLQHLAAVTEVNRASLGATALVFFLTFWGGISFVKGSTKPRETQASFTIREPASAVLKRTAAYLMQRSFKPDLAREKDSRAGVMTFTGEVRASTSVAVILVAVGASSIWAATYILNFLLPEGLQSSYWGLLSVGALALVPWYWKEAARTEEVKVMVEEEGDLSTLFMKGHRDEIEELEKALQWKRNEPVYEGSGDDAGGNK